MAVGSVVVIAPATGGTITTLITRPAVTVVWADGTGPFNIEVEWADNAGFVSPTARTVSGVTSPHTVAPAADLTVSDGETWYLRATVTDTDDAQTLTSDAVNVTYLHPRRSKKILAAQANVGWGVTPGDARTADRHITVQGNVGYGYGRDRPAGGWGPNDPEDDAPDGLNRTLARHLAAQANVDNSQPCPRVYTVTPDQVDAGDTVVVTGAGLVSADSPTDAYAAEVRLHTDQTPGSAYTVLAATAWTAGDEDTVTVTVPASARSGWVGVAHTQGATCGGSNRVALSVATTTVDPDEGWRVEVWDRDNRTRRVGWLPDVYTVEYEMIAGDVGSGAVSIPAGHPHLDLILGGLVKVYAFGRYQYGFLPASAVVAWADDDSTPVRVHGPGPESVLDWGRCLWADHPAQPTSARERVYGSAVNLTSWGDFNPDSAVVNGGGEDQVPDPWYGIGGGLPRASDTEMRTGVGSIRAEVASVGGGIGIGFPADGYTLLDVSTKVNTVGATHTIRVVDADTSTVLTDTVWVPGATAWSTHALAFTHVGQVSLEVVVTGGRAADFWVDDAAAYTGVPPDLDADGTTVRWTRTLVADGTHSIRVAGAATGGWVGGTFGTVAGYRYTVTVLVAGPAGQQARLETRLGGVGQISTVALVGPTRFVPVTVSGTAEAAGRETIRLYTPAQAGVVWVVGGITTTQGEPAATVGGIILDVHEAMAARGALPDLQLGFTRTEDSAGVAWPETISFTVQPAWTLLDLTRKIQGQGYEWELAPVDWRAGGDTGWRLDVWTAGGRGTNHTTGGPAVLPAPNILSASSTRRTPTETVVYAEGAEGVWTVAAAHGERREGYVSNTTVGDPVALARVAAHRLGVGGDTHTIRVDPAETGPTPMLDYRPGDRLRAHLPADGNDLIPDGTYLVAAVTFRGGPARDDYEVDLGGYPTDTDRTPQIVLARLAAAGGDVYQPGVGSTVE